MNEPPLEAPTANRFSLSLVANRHCAPAATLLQVHNPDADDWSELLACSALSQLPGLNTAFYQATTPITKELAELLEARGYVPLPETECVRNDDAPPDPQSKAIYFHGSWYLHGQAPSTPTASHPQVLRILQLVMSDAEHHAIEAALRNEPTLSYYLLRLVNSPALSQGRSIRSLSQALMILGRAPLKRWLNLMLFTARKDDPRALMLLAHVCLRARTLELVAQAQGGDRTLQEEAFLTGLFSMLGLLFGKPMQELLGPLSLPQRMHAALLQGEGPLSPLLALVLAAEAADIAAIATTLPRSGIVASTFDEIRLVACLWMWEIVTGVSSGDPHV